MSFQKAHGLPKLMDMSASYHDGITMNEIGEGFRVNEGAAMRMISAITTTARAQSSLWLKETG
jgi:hypothetical protein